MITSSIKLQMNHVVEIKPWLILKLLGEEFISLNPFQTMEVQYVFTEQPVGTIMFNKEIARIYQEDETFYLRFEDGRVLSLTTQE